MPRIEEYREPADSLPEPWRSVAMNIQSIAFCGPITVMVTREDGKITGIRDAIGPVFLNIETPRRHGIITFPNGGPDATP
jgi:hypothetical protein